MNIFKVLSSGDRKLKEENLSAFLAYILNPKADHGLNSAFLEKFLEPFLKLNTDSNPLQPLFSGTDESVKEEYLLDLSIHSRFNVEVALEKALRKSNNNSEIEDDNSDGKRRKKTKEIVDIFVKITAREKKKEDISYLFKEEEPVALLLVEIKLKHDGDVFKQIKDQYDKSLEHLKDNVIKNAEKWNKWEKNVCTVLVTAYDKDLNNKISQFQNSVNENSIFYTWDYDTKEQKSIKTLINNVLQEHNEGTVAPVPTYTADTLRALINFIENKFSSDADDQRRGGKRTKDSYNTLEDSITKGDGRFNIMSDNMKNWIKQLDNEIKKQDELKPYYFKSRISVGINGKSIWNIHYQAKNFFTIHYVRTSRPFKKTDKRYDKPNGELNYYERKNIPTTEEGIQEAMDYLKYVKDNQI